jgi:hypothetical protein
MSKLDPIDISLNIVVNITSSILENQAGRLENTLLVRVLKIAGLISPDFYDRLQLIVRESVKYFFDNHPNYKRQSIVDFFQDGIISKQIAAHILERKPIDEAAILGKLQEYSRSEPETLVSLRSHELSEGRIIQDFFLAYQLVQNEHLEPGQIAIIAALDSVKEELRAELIASENRLRHFIVEISTKDNIPFLIQDFEVDEKTYIRLESLDTAIDQAIESADAGYIAIVGPPGSGKSTSITQYIKKYEIRRRQSVIRYYCFTSLTDPASHRRLNKSEFLDSVIQQLQQASHSVSEEIAKDAQTIKHVGYSSSEERRLDLIQERLKTFLSKLSLSLEKIDRKLLVVIDGIDHVARASVNESNQLLSALPYPLPKRIICLVGTQSIQYLPPTIQHDCQSNGVIDVPRFNELQIRKYVGKFNALHSLTDQRHLQKISSLTCGVPLQLRYVVTQLQDAKSSSEVSDRLSRMPLYDHDIESYYWNIWNNLNSESIERNEARICELLARSPFPVKKEPLARLLETDVDKLLEALSRVEYLLIFNDGYRIFHESFRAFVEQQLDDLRKQELDRRLFDYLNVEELGKDLWYRYGFKFALQVGNYEYLANHTNTALIETSIANGRSKYELISNLRLAAEASRKSSNPQALARIGALVAHTSNRFDYHLNSYDLFACLLAIGEVEQALEMIEPESAQQETQYETADLIVFLAVEGYQEKARELANLFFDRLPRKIDTIDQMKSIAKLLTIFSELPADTLSHWIDSHKDHSGLGGKYTTTGCDLLETVLSFIYKFKRFELKRALKRLLFSGDNSIFWQSKWYLYVALLEAEYKPEVALNHIKKASTYATDKVDRILLAGLSAKLNAESDFVMSLIRDVIELPPTDNQAVSYLDGSKHFNIFRSYIRALEHSGKHEEINAIRRHLKAYDTWMAFYHLVCIDLVINSAKSNPSDEFIFAPLEQLRTHKKQENERIFEVFNAIKEDLPQFIQIVVDTYFEHHTDPNPIISRLTRLKEIEVLNTHYGIGLAIKDYTQEIHCLEAFVNHQLSHEHLRPLLLDFHERIKNETLETETRTRSLLELARLSAAFGFRQYARDLLLEARYAARGYGYRKDSTISILINALEIVNKYDQDKALERFADIGHWIRWLPQITDGAGTKWFNHILFEAVLEFDFGLATQLLLTYYDHIARWKFYDCLAKLLQRYQGPNLKLAYVLSELVSEWDDNGFKDKFDTRLHLLDQAIMEGAFEKQEWLGDQLRQFILTEVDPRERRDFVEKYNEKASEHKLPAISGLTFEPETAEQEVPNQPIRNNQKSIINGTEVDLAEHIAGVSNISEFGTILDHLDKEEIYGFRQETQQKLRELLDEITTIADIDGLLNEYVKYGRLDSEDHEAIARAYAQAGSRDKSLHHYGEAFRELHSWGLFDKEIKYLRPLINDDTSQALEFLLEVSEASIQTLSYAGVGVATLLIRVFDELGDEYREVILEIYDDFHEFVAGMFSDLPDLFEEDIYDWLRQPSPDYIDFEEFAVRIILNEWGKPILHRRLYFTHHLPDLAIDNPDLWLPIIIQRLQDKNLTLRTQAAVVLHAISLRQSNLLSDYVDEIILALESPHIEVSRHLLSVLEQFTGTSEYLDEYLKSYYPVLEQHSVLMPDFSPSLTYRDKILGRSSLTIQEMISDVCEGLGIDEDTMHWKIEQRLAKIGYQEEIAEAEHRSRWDIYRQGSDGDFIYFETYASYFLYHAFATLLDEMIRSKPYPPDIIDTLYKRVSVYDPHLPLKNVEAKPAYISIPNLTLSRHRTELTAEITEWLNFADVDNDEITRPLSDGWTSIGQVGSISKGWLHESRQEFSCLINIAFAKQITSGAAKPEAAQAVLVLAPQPPHYTITVSEARILLHISKFSGELDTMRYIPLIAVHANDWWYYFRTQTILGVAGNWIREWNLSWSTNDGLDMYQSNRKVVQHNYWCDGFFTGLYEYSSAGSGTELLISSTFLNELMSSHNLCLLKTSSLTRIAFAQDSVVQKNKRTFFNVIFPERTM